MRIFNGLVKGAVDAVPECRGAPMLRALVKAESERLIPPALLAERHLRVAA
jgi:geranylgeranyl diphosphate synthase type II